MTLIAEVCQEARRLRDAGDPEGALRVLRQALSELEAQGDYDLMAKWTLLDEQVACLEALDQKEAVREVRAEQARVAMAHDSKRATGEARARHVVTDDKKDLPGPDRRPAPEPEDPRQR